MIGLIILIVALAILGRLLKAAGETVVTVIIIMALLLLCLAGCATTDKRIQARAVAEAGARITPPKVPADQFKCPVVAVPAKPAAGNVSKSAADKYMANLWMAWFECRSKLTTAGGLWSDLTGAIAAQQSKAIPPEEEGK